jgi:branched-chain amino acid transport system ATP-binding protein
MLDLKDMHVHYGKAHAIKGISLSVNNGEIVTVLGPNGAGKSTLLNAISGLLKISSGQIMFDGKRIDNQDSDYVVKAGIVQVPQGRQLFPAMTVLENLEMGAFLSGDLEKLEAVFSLFPQLEERKSQLAGTLSGGQAQMLAIGRGLMAKPRLLMLDEPSLGLSPLLVQDLQKAIKQISENEVAILLVEQNARMALDIAHRAYVLQLGNIFTEGPAEELKKGDYLKRAYLG